MCYFNSRLLCHRCKAAQCFFLRVAAESERLRKLRHDTERG